MSTVEAFGRDVMSAIIRAMRECAMMEGTQEQIYYIMIEKVASIMEEGLVKMMYDPHSNIAATAA